MRAFQGREIAARLESLKDQKERSGIDFCKEAGVSHSQYWATLQSLRKLGAKSNAAARTLFAFAEAGEVSLDWLIYGEEAAEPATIAGIQRQLNILIAASSGIEKKSIPERIEDAAASAATGDSEKPIAIERVGKSPAARKKIRADRKNY